MNIRRTKSYLYLFNNVFSRMAHFIREFSYCGNEFSIIQSGKR